MTDRRDRFLTRWTPPPRGSPAFHAASRFQGVRRPLPEVPAFDSSNDNRKAPPRALAHKSAQGRDSGIASRPFVVDNRKPPPVPRFDSVSDRRGDRTAIRRPPVPAFDDSNNDLVEEEIMDRRPPAPAFDDSRNQSKQNARASLPPVPAFHDSPRQRCPTNDHRKRPPADSHDNERNQKRRAVKAKSEEQNVIAPDIIDLTGEPDNFVEEPQSLPPLVHIIFAVDFSGSMKNKDVETSNGRISRWDAVFRCMDEFLTEQEQQEDNGACMSVLIFNNDAQALLNRMPLKDGKKVHDALDTARNMHTPRGGTSFSAGCKLARTLAHNDKDEKVVVVFLSDGRPGDLNSNPPATGMDMQKNYKFKGELYPSAGIYIDQMQKELKDDLTLHFICLYDEGKPWLNFLATRYKGTFHKPNLSLEDERGYMPVQPAAEGSDEDEAVPMKPGSQTDDEIQEIRVRSQDTRLRENYEQALAMGKVVSLTSTTTARRTSSMRSTFQSISSSVSAMRTGGLQERQVKIAQQSLMISYPATRMVLSDDYEKFTTAPGETSNGRIVKVARHPFAQGGLRNVYRMKQAGEPRQVAKESRHDIKYNDRLRFHLETAKCQVQAAKFAKSFNKRLKKAKKDLQAEMTASLPHIEVLRAEVYRLKDDRSPGGFRYLAVEKEMNGTYDKWNNNNGYVNPSDCLICQVAQAFSHYSYEYSEQREMVVDLQGTGYTLTDPQLHSAELVYGRADKGKSGFVAFFKTHKCNFICKCLGLKSRWHNG